MFVDRHPGARVLSSRRCFIYLFIYRRHFEKGTPWVRLKGVIIPRIRKGFLTDSAFRRVWEMSRHKYESFFKLCFLHREPSSSLSLCLCVFSTIMSPHLIAVCQSLIHSLFWSLFIQMSNSRDILSSCCCLPLSSVTLFSQIYFLCTSIRFSPCVNFSYQCFQIEH